MSVLGFSVSRLIAASFLHHSLHLPLCAFSIKSVQKRGSYRGAKAGHQKTKLFPFLCPWRKRQHFLFGGSGHYFRLLASFFSLSSNCLTTPILSPFFAHSPDKTLSVRHTCLFSKAFEPQCTKNRSPEPFIPIPY